jgi:glycosyltransferase involved in cell wall biosynthesis
VLRILVDASSLGDESARRGVGTYVRGLLPALADQPDVEVRALAPASATLPGGVHHVVIRRRALPRLTTLEDDLRLPMEIRRQRRHADVFLGPSVAPPTRCALPHVQVLYDVIPLVHPDPLFDHARRMWRRIGPRYRRADAVVAISRASAEAGIAHLGLDPGRVEVVLPGLVLPGPPADAGAGAGARPTPTPYLLVASTWSPNKGFGEAMAVVGALAEAGYPHRLAIAGDQGPFARTQIEVLRAASPHPERVDVLGWVDDLGAWLRHADAVLVPSHVEGFGYPAAEAMAHGAPTVAFANSSLPEAVGDGGVLVPDGDVAAMAAAVRRIVDDPVEAARLRDAGRRRAAELRWDLAAERIVATCRRISGS